MARNVEIKARVKDPAKLRVQIAQVCHGEPTVLIQRDTFYKVPSGRLKLREIRDGHSELIFYERLDNAGPKTSTYTVTPVNALSMHELLGRFLRVRGVVSKRRELFLAGQTRIHLDELDGLGCFVELEVVLQTDQLVSEGVQIAAQLRQQLGIHDEDLIDTAYVDLLEAAAGGNS